MKPIFNSAKNLTPTNPKSEKVSDEANYFFSPFYEAFAPLLSSLKLWGLYYCKTKRSDINGILYSLSRLYCWVTTIIAWVMALRAFVSLRLMKQIDPVTLFNLCIGVFFILTAMNATTFLKASYDSRSLRKFFLGFVKLEKYGGPFLSPKNAKQITSTATKVCWLGIMTNICITSVLTFKFTVFDILAADPFLETGSVGQLIVKSVFICCCAYLTAMWIFPSAIDFSIAFLLYKEFRLFRKSFKAKMDDHDKFLGSMENERCRYLQMCRIIEAADDALALHHGASFSCNIVTMCLLLYSIIYYSSIFDDLILSISYAFWLCSSVVDMVVVCTCGILIKTSVG